MRTTSGTFKLRTVRRHAARELTARKHAELAELARRFGRARQEILRDYWHPKYAVAILAADRALVEHRRRTGWPSAELSVHQNKVCLETTLALVRSGWRRATAGAIREVERNAFWDSDRWWALEVLRTPALLGACLLRSPKDATASERRLRRLVLRLRGRRPRLGRSLWFEIDCNLYRPFERVDDRHFRGAWLAITGVKRGTRVNVPLAGESIADFGSRTSRTESRPNVRVTVGARIVFHVVTRVAAEQPRGQNVVGIDKGLGTLLVLSEGNATQRRYGAGCADLVDAIVLASTTRRRQRQRVAAYERSIRNTQPRRSRLIRRRNLGAAKSDRADRRERAQLRDFVNQSVNAMFADNKNVSRIYCEDLSFRRPRAARAFNRRLGRWLKGYLHERLAYKAELNGVELQVVNAAYTSQTCPRCWFTSEQNRRADTFSCADCGYAGSADGVAATNVLRRGSDTAIARFTPVVQVKQILEARWRSARIGRAWGSNEVAPVTDVSGSQPPTEPRTGTLPTLSSARSPYGGALSTLADSAEEGA